MSDSPPANPLLFVSSVNRSPSHDATGAFLPESLGFVKCHAIPSERRVLIDCESKAPAVRRRKVLEAISDFSRIAPIDFLAFFGHGWPDGIQFGFNRRNLGLLVACPGARWALPLRVCLYTCLTADDGVENTPGESIAAGTDGGFADLLRDAFLRAGVSRGWVDAHKIAGHCTMNPHVVRFEFVNSPTIGGRWLVEPGSAGWTAWVKDLKTSDLRWRYPLEGNQI